MAPLEKLFRYSCLTALTFTLTSSDLSPPLPPPIRQFRRNEIATKKAPSPELNHSYDTLHTNLTRFITDHGDTCRLIVQDPATDYIIISHRQTELFHPASTVKMLIAFSVIQGVLTKNIDLNQSISITYEDIVGGSGVGLQPGSYSTEQLLSLMLEKSDNTASNAIRKAYLPFVNETIQTLNLNSTAIDRGYFDHPETGALTTSTQDLTTLYQAIYDLLNQHPQSTTVEKFYDWIIHRDTQLVTGDTVLAKYGEIDGLLAEAGIYYGKTTALIYSLSCDSQDRKPFQNLSQILERINEQPIVRPITSSPYSSP